jgi:hypothetical protein
MERLIALEREDREREKEPPFIGYYLRTQGMNDNE